MKTILVVEDNTEVRNEIADVFKMEDFEVIEAGNGLDGYIKAVNYLPDIIVSDIMMPILNGYKMYKELKNNANTDQIPVIFLSALSSNEDIRKGMNTGADDYLIKPVNPDDLINAAESKLKKAVEFENKFNDVKINITNILYHEINTPLNGILGFSDYLRTKSDELSKENIKKVAHNIYISGRRLNKLVKKYLAYSELKINTANVRTIKKFRNCQYVNTEDIIKKVIDEDEFNKRENDFKLDLQSVNLKIEDDLFKLLVSELIDNAVKFSKSGQNIFINSFIKKNTFVFQIKNEGSGLSKEQIVQLNDFIQLNTAKYAQNGTGIGLSIVKLVADIYRAELVFDSIPNNYFSVKVSFCNFYNSDMKN